MVVAAALGGGQLRLFGAGGAPCRPATAARSSQGGDACGVVRAFAGSGCVKQKARQLLSGGHPRMGHYAEHDHHRYPIGADFP